MTQSRGVGSACAAFFGLSGTTINSNERAFFKDVQPAGFILFARNIDTPDQVRALCGDLASLTPVQPAPILIDQEGGRVARLRPPHWLAHPPCKIYGAINQNSAKDARRAAWLHGRLIGHELAELGISVACLPVLDVRHPDTHDVIGDRAFCSDTDVVAALGQAVCDGLLAAGVVPVMKHIPGHGRGRADSHLELPIVDAARSDLLADAAAFQQLKNAPMGMTAHILFTQLDPQRCATLSAHIVGEVIRKTLGFDGLLMTDDLSMKALGGTMAWRTGAALDAGCDLVLHCNGDMAEMREVATALRPLNDASAARLQRAMAAPQAAPHAAPTPALTSADVNELVAQRNALIEQHCGPQILRS